MTDKPIPTDAELKAMWQLHAADIGGIFYYARAVLAKWGTPAPVGVEPSYTSVQLAEMVLSDCGHSSDYTPLLNRVAARIDAHAERCLDELRVGLEPQPVAREPLTPERVKEIVRGAGYDQCGIPDTERSAFINGLRHGEREHGIKGDQHGTE